MSKYKGYNSSHVCCQVKGWYKKSCEIFSNEFGKGFYNGMMEGKKMGSYKKDFDVALFFSSQNIDFPFLFEETLGAFLFLSFPFSFFLSLSFSFSLFFNTFALFFSMLHLFEVLWIFLIFEEKNNLQKFFSNGMG
jgi:hypothetical protein